MQTLWVWKMHRAKPEAKKSPFFQFKLKLEGEVFRRMIITNPHRDRVCVCELRVESWELREETGRGFLKGERGERGRLKRERGGGRGVMKAQEKKEWRGTGRWGSSFIASCPLLSAHCRDVEVFSLFILPKGPCCGNESSQLKILYNKILLIRYFCGYYIWSHIFN